MSRAWLFLDLDGVVSPVPVRGTRGEIRRSGPPAGYRTWEHAVYDMYVDERLNDWADALDEAFDVVWSSSWGELLLRAVAEPLGLPVWPVLPIPVTTPRPHSKIGYKARATAGYLAADPRPFAWCDDFIHHPSRLPKEMRTVELPHLLISPTAGSA